MDEKSFRRAKYVLSRPILCFPILLRCIHTVIMQPHCQRGEHCGHSARMPPWTLQPAGGHVWYHTPSWGVACSLYSTIPSLFYREWRYHFSPFHLSFLGIMVMHSSSAQWAQVQQFQLAFDPNNEKKMSLYFFHGGIFYFPVEQSTSIKVTGWNFINKN